MKTNVIMTRPMGQFEVLQRTSDGWFDANALLTQWNSIRENPQRAMSRFLDSPNTKTFIEALQDEVSRSAEQQVGDIQVVKKVKGRNTLKGGFNSVDFTELKLAC